MNYKTNTVENINLKPYNTFGLSANAKDFHVVTSEEELTQFLSHHPGTEIRILGGGSNILITEDQHGSILKIAIPGIRIADENQDTVVVEAGAGEVWHSFVRWTLEHDFGGLENLSLIPGCVGAAPMQNIGAYGVEQDDCFAYLEAINLQTGELRKFERADCAFGYRESIFKHQLKGQFVIVRVAYRLSRHVHTLHTEYGAIRSVLEEKGITNPTIHDVSNAVIAIRTSKLPDPKVTGNAGSFFKNPVISAEQFTELKENHPNIPGYAQPDGAVKVAAGWLIEQCGLKGYRQGDAGVHSLQALVLVNHGTATGKEIVQLSKFIQAQVYNTFQISIEPEVNVW